MYCIEILSHLIHKSSQDTQKGAGGSGTLLGIGVEI